MPYNERIGSRVRSAVFNWPNTAQKKMFGGVCHLIHGNMFCGVYKDFLILRLGEEGAVSALGLPHVRPFDITGRPMKGWVMVGEDGIPTDDELRSWLTRARRFAETLPPK